MDKNNYMTRSGGATVTIFVPYDCNNNCPFCINKDEYSDSSNFNIEKIIESIKILDEITPTCDFVLTGGEPFANLTSLQRILNAIPNTHKIFINTTLPINVYTPGHLIAFINNNANKITGLNVSRHLVGYVNGMSIEDMEELKPSIRINCVLYGIDYDKLLLKKFITVFSHTYYPIQFRKDYRFITPENIFDLNNDTDFQKLKKAFNYLKPVGKDRIRCGYEFEYGGKRIVYHKTLPYSKIKTGNGTILYDIIIRQDGTIMDDWNGYGELLDIEKYKKVSFYNKEGN